MTSTIVTLESVKRGKEALESAGTYPSVDALRAYLGGGSNSTINKYLRQLKQQETGMLNELGQVSEELAGLVLKLNRCMAAEAQATIDAAVGKVREEAGLAVTAAREAAAEHQQAAALNIEMANDLRARLTTAEKVLGELSTKHSAGEVEIARLKAELTAANDTVADRDRQLAVTQGHLSHERAARERQDTAHEAQRNEMQLTHKAAVDKLIGNLTETESLLEESQLTISSHSKRIMVMEREAQLKDIKINELNVQLEAQIERFELHERDIDELRIQLAGDAARVQLLSEQNQSLARQLDDRLSEVSTVKANAAHLEGELSSARATIDTLEERLAIAAAKTAKPGDAEPLTSKEGPA